MPFEKSLPKLHPWIFFLNIIETIIKCNAKSCHNWPWRNHSSRHRYIPPPILAISLHANPPGGARRSWNRLIEGQCGIRSLCEDERFNALPSRIAATVPLGNKEQGGWAAKEWLRAGDERTMALFTQYAMAAATEALDDAGWKPTAEEDLESTVWC